MKVLFYVGLFCVTALFLLVAGIIMFMSYIIFFGG